MFDNCFKCCCKDGSSAAVVKDVKVNIPPSVILRRMQYQEGQFEAKSAGQLEVLLTTEGETQQRVSSLSISFKPTRDQLWNLSRFPNLVKLSLHGACIGSEISSLITPGVLPRTLTSLDLSRNRLYEAGAAYHLTEEDILPPNLTSLNLHGNHRADVCGFDAALLLRKRTLSRLTSVDFGENQIRGRGIASSLEPGVFSAELKVLNLEENSLFGGEGVEALSRPGVLPKELVSLNLRRCGITSEGVMHLSRADLSKLENLTLDKNTIGADGVAYLVGSVSFRKSLTCLYLQGCGIDHIGANHLRDAIPSFVKLKKIILTYNKMGEGKAVELCETFPKLELKVNHNERRLAYTPYGLNFKEMGFDSYEEYVAHQNR